MWVWFGTAKYVIILWCLVLNGSGREAKNKSWSAVYTITHWLFRALGRTDKLIFARSNEGLNERSLFTGKASLFVQFMCIIYLQNHMNVNSDM